MSDDNKQFFINRHRFGSLTYVKQFLQDTQLNPFSFVRVTLTKMISSEALLFNLKLFVFMIVLFSSIRIIQFLLGAAS
ncbi:hypothetical protein V0R37_15065 [Pollutimonas sp. H1-120]|uniref:hypothetical protein n=1 Tax=Pollutimonas sp. H1-120 TaxID=3148824 RepID=UPI003B524943